MLWTPRQPERLGDERRDREEAILHDIKSAGAEKCPECGSAQYKHVNGCMLCLSCGFSPCGAH